MKPNTADLFKKAKLDLIKLKLHSIKCPKCFKYGLTSKKIKRTNYPHGRKSKGISVKHKRLYCYSCEYRKEIFLSPKNGIKE